MYSSVEIDSQFVEGRSPSITEILMTDLALLGVRNKNHNLARDFKDFEPERLQGGGKLPAAAENAGTDAKSGSARNYVRRFETVVFSS